VTVHIQKTVEIDKNDLVLEFKLQDEFKNVFNTSEIIEYLFIENNGINVGYSIVYNGDQTYRATIKPEYPPREVNIQMYYKDNSTKVELLPEIETSTFKFKLDYSKTIVKLFKDYKPSIFYAIIGTIFTLISIGFAIPVFIDYFKTGLVPRFPTLIFSGFMLMKYEPGPKYRVLKEYSSQSRIGI
jgi:hypothetical protein